MKDEHLSLHPQVAMQTIDGVAVMVLADSGRVLVLNALGTRIIELLISNQSVVDIADIIVSEYQVSMKEARHDLDSFLRKLREAGALT